MLCRYKVPASPPPPLGKLLNPQLANPLPPQPAPTALGPVNNWYAQETQVGPSVSARPCVS